MSDRKITLRKTDGMEDWYTVEWEEHDGKQWLAPIDGALHFMTSARLGNADIEGTGDEMLEIAEALEENESAYFKRCAVMPADAYGNFNIWSPRNSMRETLITKEQAAYLAKEIRRVLAEGR